MAEQPGARLLAGLLAELRSRGMLVDDALAADTSIAIGGVAFDSRVVAPGEIFVAVPGAEVDGHDFAVAAVGRGAVALIVERRLPGVTVPQLLVRSARAALAVGAAWLQGFPSRELGVVGITGTDGKTTTSFMVRAMLAEAGLPAGLISTVEAIVGGQSRGYTGHTTPEAPVIQSYLRAMVDTGDRFAVLETTSHGLALERVAEVAYDVAVLTNITHEHLDLHGTFAAYVGAKRSLFESLAPGPANPEKGWGKWAVVNSSDALAGEFVGAARHAGARVLTYALGGTAADVTAVTVRDTDHGLLLRVHTARWQDDVAINLVGRFNAFNALAAIGVGEALGLDPAAVRRGLAGLSHISGRMVPIDEGQPFGVYVDFAHTPGALAAALDGLAPLAAARGGGLISLFGSPGARDIAKRPMMGRAAGERSRAVVLTDDDPRSEDRMTILEEIAAGAEAAGRRRDHDLFLVPDRAQAIRHALELARPGDIVLLAGKGHEPTLATAAGPVPWDEAALARAALRELGYNKSSG